MKKLSVVAVTCCGCAFIPTLLAQTALDERPKFEHRPSEAILIAGKYYHDVRIEDAGRDPITLYTREGNVSARWSSLPMDLQRKYAPARQAALTRNNTKDDPLTFGGKIVQVIPKAGLLVHQYGDADLDYLLIGYPEEGKVADGDALPMMKVSEAGLYHFTTVLGSARTVRAYRFASLSGRK